MYTLIYKNTRLLYINNDHSFRFMDDMYKAKQMSDLKWIYWREKPNSIE